MQHMQSIWQKKKLKLMFTWNTSYKYDEKSQELAEFFV